MGLIDSLPSNNRRGQRLRQIPGMTPNLLNLPLGLRHALRAPAPPVSARPSSARPCPATALLPPHHPDPGGGGMAPNAKARGATPRNPARATRRTPRRRRARHAPDRAAQSASASANARGRRAVARAGLSRPPAVTRAVDGVDLIVRPGGGRPGRRVRLRQSTLRRGRRHAVRRRGPINGLRPPT